MQTSGVLRKISKVVFCRYFQAQHLPRGYFQYSSMPSALVILAKGAEEMETVISVDVLRRGEIDVTVAGLAGEEHVLCSRNVVIKPDISFDEAVKKDFDVIVLPGGLEGANNLAESSKVGELLKKQEGAGKFIACICAAPIALKSHGIAQGKKLTSHPSVKDTLTAAGYQYDDANRVVVDGKLITSRAPGTCFEFALQIVEELQGKEKRSSIIPPMLLKL